jgi:hypothetical protein
MFKHIVALNTYTEPFLALKANDQRTIIEQLLGITMLSDKADLLKEQLKATRDAITAEEYRIKAVNDANARIQEQIDATKRRQTMWNTKRLSEIVNLQQAQTAMTMAGAIRGNESSTAISGIINSASQVGIKATVEFLQSNIPTNLPNLGTPSGVSGAVGSMTTSIGPYL